MATAADKKIVRKRIDHKIFIDTWMSASKNNESQSDIAAKLGCTPGAVSSLAARLRKDGVKLPSLTVTRGPKPPNVEALNQQIKNFYSK